jgi:hypothetical protein
MPRIIHGIGRGYNNRTGFRNPTNPGSMNIRFIRPPFSSAVSHFIRKTAATYFTPMAFGAEGGGAAYTLSIGSGSIGLTGTSVNLKVSRVASISSGALTLAGTGLELKFGRKSSITSGNISLAGTAINLKADRKLSIVSGALTLLGTDTGLNYGRKISIGSGSIALSGTSIVIKIDRSISLDNGELVLSGTDIILKKGFTLSIENGSLTIVGTAIGLSKSVSYLSDAIRLYNDAHLCYHLIPLDEDLHIMADGSIIGVLIVPATDDHAGSIRIKINGTVKALKQAA